MNDLNARVAVLEQIAKDTQATLLDLRTEMREMRRDERNQFRTLMFTVIGTAIAAGGVMLAGQANLLSAFQSGLSAVQAAGSRPEQPPPLILQIPVPTAPAAPASTPPPAQPQ